MKKISLLLCVVLAALSCVFVACGGSDEFEDELSPVSDKNKMAGKWKNTITRLDEGNQTIEWTFNSSATAEQVKVNDAVSNDNALKARESENMKILHYSGKQYTVSFGTGLEYEDWKNGMASLGMNIEYNGIISGVIRGFLSTGSSKILKLSNYDLVIETVNGNLKFTRTFKKVS